MDISTRNTHSTQEFVSIKEEHLKNNAWFGNRATIVFICGQYTLLVHSGDRVNVVQAICEAGVEKKAGCSAALQMLCGHAAF